MAVWAPSESPIYFRLPADGCTGSDLSELLGKLQQSAWSRPCLHSNNLFRCGNEFAALSLSLGETAPSHIMVRKRIRGQSQLGTDTLAPGEQGAAELPGKREGRCPLINGAPREFRASGRQAAPGCCSLVPEAPRSMP